MYTVRDFVEVYSSAIKAVRNQVPQDLSVYAGEEHDYLASQTLLAERVVTHIAETYSPTLTLEGHLDFTIEIIANTLEISVGDINAALGFIFTRYNEILLKKIQNTYAEQRVLQTFRR